MSDIDWFKSSADGLDKLGMGSERTPDPAVASSASETQLTLREQLITDLERYKNFGTPFTGDMADHILALFTQALTSLTGLACDKCRVRMEDKLNNGGTQHESLHT